MTLAVFKALHLQQLKGINVTLKDAKVQRSLSADETQALALAKYIIKFNGFDGDAAMSLAALVDQIIPEHGRDGNDQKARVLAIQVKLFQGRDGDDAIKLAELVVSVLSD